jgi:hypothetical protein
LAWANQTLALVAHKSKCLKETFFVTIETAQSLLLRQQFVDVIALSMTAFCLGSP